MHLLRTGSRECVVLLVLHHLVFDGGSLHPLVTRLLSFYEQLSRGGQPQLQALDSVYEDYVQQEAAALSGATGQDRLAFWRQELDQAPAQGLAPDHDLAAARPFTGAAWALM